jgi:hypothetical protein
MLFNRILFAALSILIVCFMQGCKEELLGPLPNNGGAAPPPVSNLKVMNLPGAAKISYTVPGDPNLLYVEAVWTYKGNTRNAKSSYYSDTLSIEGFGDTSECEVKLYSVSTGEKRSEPVSTIVKPLTSPVEEVFKSLTVKPDFGGINVGFHNATGSNIVISVLIKDSIGDLVQADAFYTNLVRDSFSTRGFEATPRLFGVFVKDRWNNLSDTLFITETPFFEKQLSKLLFKELNPYPGDVNDQIYSAAYPMRNLWDNANAIFVTKQGLGLPESFTIDLGVTAKLSRMKYLQRQSTAFYYASGTPEIFEVYGSNNPAPDGDWASWTLLSTCVSKKPSGLPLNIVTNDDLDAAKAGEDFNFPVSAEAYRYLRFRVLKNYGNASNITFAELTFWGAF